ncbi:MAG: hypothetical protein HYV27_04480 [Candidatus Hydrogenedentes bacterium]|nr:hypothetical protein [Candidatus Hydrogenedentota bacterium]
MKLLPGLIPMLALLLSPLLFAEERLETFDRDPGWDALNNRPAPGTAREVVQDFGFSAAKAVDGGGAIGGSITPDGHPAYYAKIMEERSLNDAMSASGKLFVKSGAGNTLLGFFNAGTLNEWRTPNSVVFRINGRGETFHMHTEYATSKWRAGAGLIGSYNKETDRNNNVELPSGQWYDWTLRYDPAANDGGGGIHATFGEYESFCPIFLEHRKDGATFNRFGILNVVKSVDSPGELWVSKLSLEGAPQDFSADPQWESLRNRETYTSQEVRPVFDVGFSATNHAGGGASGEFGGLFFRGDCRYPEKLGYYGAPLNDLDLSKPLKASGKITLRRGVSDSTSIFGFFHAKDSVEVNPSQQFGTPMNFLGFAVEGPSAEGFFVYPTYRIPNDHQGNAAYGDAPSILPDGATHTWTLLYEPPQDGEAAHITVTLDDQSVTLPLPAEVATAGARFNRFGFVSPWIDGNGQRVYLDDITYTFKQ